MYVWQEEFPDCGWDKWLPSRMRLYLLSAWLMTTPSLFSLTSLPSLGKREHQKIDKVLRYLKYLVQVTRGGGKAWTTQVMWISSPALVFMWVCSCSITGPSEQKAISIRTSYYRMQQVFGSLGTRYFHSAINIMVTGQAEKLLTNTKWKSKVHWTMIDTLCNLDPASSWSILTDKTYIRQKGPLLWSQAPARTHPWWHTGMCRRDALWLTPWQYLHQPSPGRLKGLLL